MPTMNVAKPSLIGIPQDEKLAIGRDRILAIGGPGIGRQSLLVDLPNLHEFGAVILYIRSVPQEAHSGQMSATRERFSELLNWVKAGHTLVVLGTMPDFSWQIRTPGNQLAVTSLQNTELFSGITYRHTTGKLVEFVGPSSIAYRMERWTQDLVYDAILSGAELFPIFRVSKQSGGPDQIVGGFRKLGLGTAVFLPILPTGAAQYLVDVAQISSELKEIPDELPAWSAEYKTTIEKNAVKKIATINAEIDKLTTSRGEFDSVAALEQIQKRLFIATGDILVDSVVRCLTELGLKAIQGPRQRADVIAWDGSRLMAIEVKGLEGVAREGNLRQADRWKADILAAIAASPEELAVDDDLMSYRDCLSKLNVPLDDGRPTDCKGVMIINTHRKQSLRERAESFPDPLRKVIVRSNVCALTGLQLFGIGSKVADGSLSKSEAVDELFSKAGVSELAPDWQSFLSQ